MKGSKNTKYCYKYDKITLQKKFHLLNLVLREKMLIKEAAKIVGINYSTAKTILFFNRNGDKSYQFDIYKPTPALDPEYPSPPLRTSFIDLSVKFEEGSSFSLPRNTIDIISTIGSKTQALQKIKQEKRTNSFSISQHPEGVQLGVITEPLGSLDGCNHEIQGAVVGTARPMTRSQAARLSNKDRCKVEEFPQNSGSLISKQLHNDDY